MLEFNWMTIKFGSAKQKRILHVIRVRKLDHQQMWRWTRRAVLILVFARRFPDIPSPETSARIQCIVRHGILSSRRVFQPRGSKQIREYDETAVIPGSRTSAEGGDYRSVAGLYCTVLIALLSCLLKSSQSTQSKMRLDWVRIEPFSACITILKPWYSNNLLS